MNAIEQLADKWRLEIYGVCAKCGVRLSLGNKFVEVSEGTCGSSHGEPCTYIEKPKRYHEACFVAEKTKRL